MTRYLRSIVLIALVASPHYVAATQVSPPFMQVEAIAKQANRMKEKAKGTTVNYKHIGCVDYKRVSKATNGKLTVKRVFELLSSIDPDKIVLQDEEELRSPKYMFETVITMLEPKRIEFTFKEQIGPGMNPGSTFSAYWLVKIRPLPKPFPTREDLEPTLRLPKLPRLVGAPLHWMITKANHDIDSIPFSLTVTNWFRGSVTVTLEVTAANELDRFEDVIIYSDHEWFAFWMKIAPIASTNNITRYSCNLPRNLAMQSVVALGCKKGTGTSHFYILPHLSGDYSSAYERLHRIRLGTYIDHLERPVMDNGPIKIEIKDAL